MSLETKTPERQNITYAWRQVVVPGPSVPGHALEYATAMQGVTLITAKRDGTTSKVTLVTYFKSKLRHTRIITVRQLKAWTRKIKRMSEG